MMNSQTVIQVKTAGGVSDRAVTGENFGQGTAGAALVSALNLDCGVREQFGTSQQEAQYGKIRLQPLLYQDDVARGVVTVASARAGNEKMVAVTRSKQLQLNLDKS